MKIYLGDALGGGGKDLASMKVYLGAETNARSGGGQDMKADGLHVSGEKVKTYLAINNTNDPPGVASGAKPTRPLRILLSYHYYKDEDVGGLLDSCFPGVEVDVFADSGAFSAFTVGEPIDPGKYTAWVNRWKSKFTVAAGPDVIGDAKATAKATERMLGQVSGIPVLPTFHVGEDWKWLDYWTKKVDHLAFGGMVPYTRRRSLLAGWLVKAWKRIPEGTKVHGFGLTTWPLMLQFPWHSVDSSSWTAGFRYAQLQLFDQTKGRMVEIAMRDPKSLLAGARVLAQYGLRPSDVRADGYDRVRLCGVCVESWQRVEEWISRRIYLVTGPGKSTPNHPTEIGKALRK